MGIRDGKVSLPSGRLMPCKYWNCPWRLCHYIICETQPLPSDLGEAGFSQVWFLHQRKPMSKFPIVNHNIYLILTKGIQIYIHSILKWSIFPTLLIISTNLVLANFRCKIMEWERNFLQFKKKQDSHIKTQRHWTLGAVGCGTGWVSFVWARTFPCQ